GTSLFKDSRLVAPARSNSEIETAATEIGTSTRRSERRCAVTMTSSSSPRLTLLAPGLAGVRVGSSDAPSAECACAADRAVQETASNETATFAIIDIPPVHHSCSPAVRDEHTGSAQARPPLF